jgi:hypothetical protein
VIGSAFPARYSCNASSAILARRSQDLAKLRAFFLEGSALALPKNFGASGDVPSSQTPFHQSLIASRQSLPFFQSLIASRYPLPFTLYALRFTKQICSGLTPLLQTSR